MKGKRPADLARRVHRKGRHRRAVTRVPGDTRAAAALTVSIAQFGSTRSINVAVAAGIAMHAWIRQHGNISRAW